MSMRIRSQVQAMSRSVTSPLLWMQIVDRPCGVDRRPPIRGLTWMALRKKATHAGRHDPARGQSNLLA